MVLQFEDCIDCLTCLYGNSYRFVFMFDHSCGHDCGRDDGLLVGNLKAKRGGKQNIIREMIIDTEEGYLGTFNPKVNVGDVQSSYFTEADEGPYYLHPLKRQD
jgi:hypothetical protein